MRILALSLCLGLTACSALPSPQRYGAPSQSVMLSYSIPLESNYSAEDKSDLGGFNTDGDPDLGGWSAQADLKFNTFGVLVGYNDREYGSKVNSTEYFVGGRWWLGNSSKAAYLIGVVRYSEGLDLPIGDSHAYWGYGVGGGSMTQMTDNIFLDGRIMYELLLDDIELGGPEIDLHGLVISLGVVLSQ